MSEKTIFVIRHGETDLNKAHKIQGRGINASLNERGKLQAQQIATYFESTIVEQLSCSSLKRTHETAQPLQELKNIKPEFYNELDEMNFGILEGKPFETIQKEIKHLHENWSGGNVGMAVEGGESPVEVFERAHHKVQHILGKSEKQHHVFILHGRLIRILLSEWLGMGLKNMHEIEHSNGAINILSWKEGNFKGIELNKTGHLGN